MIKVITTVGASIFTNCDKKNKNINWNYINKPFKDVEIKRSNKEKEKIKEWIAQIADKTQISAEVKSLIKLREEKNNENLEIYLLATDTIISSLAAEIVKEILEKEGFNVYYNPEIDVIKDLQVEDSKKFEQSGLVNLVNRVEKIASGYYDNIIFNITGGYKGVIPYLTILAQVRQCPIVYIFENTDTLIKIPQIPISINWGLFEKYNELLEKLNNGIYDWSKFKKSNPIQDEEIRNLIWEDGEVAELNAIGKLFFHLFKTIFIVYVYKGSNFFSDKAGNRKELESAFRELYRRLRDVINQNNIKSTSELLTYIKRLSEKEDLRHGTNPGTDKFIFKSTKKSHIRIVYSPIYENENLSLKIFDYVRGNFNHSEYIENFKKKFSIISNDIEFVPIPIKK